MRLFLISCLFFLLGACASTANYQKQMNQWQGENIQTLISKWGEPDAGIQLPNGHKVYQYTRKTMYALPHPRYSPLRASSGNRFSNYDEPWNRQQTIIRSCQTSFETTPDGEIIDVRFKGDNCISSTPF
ncbi:hypothetical protein [Rickettsiella grylli]|uniref:Lipoprotein n=1 Tax=Rickettsiella grylli TaxID=59196 RepID=A8PL19_9COXI|nr:hypothetical protein [Rickettsiella grylli]EDP45866.1 conserved hypothetical protein [Rickettsiella grylli]